ncbi:MarR family transcriptional regulator [Breoghania sp. JC706]|uniref:MarR family winged helix-turn-helix transcriptional regulator n=1 Tax=Breoghania sp. JC706 TaxID=3117732 RepID=UPI00300BD00A
MSDSSLSPRLRFGLELVLLARRWRGVVDQRLAARGLSDASWTPLVHLAESGDGIPQKELAERIGLDGSSLVRTLDHLAGQGLIERRIDPRDRRLRRIHLTPAGRQATRAIREKLASAEFELLADFSDDELSALLAGFDRLARRISKLQTPEGLRPNED